MLSLAAQCIVISPVCGFVGLCVCLWVCYHDNSKLHASIDRHQTGFIGKGSEHLQLIKFWPSRAPGNGSAAGRNLCLRLTTASAQCLRLSERLFHVTCAVRSITDQLRAYQQVNSEVYSDVTQLARVVELAGCRFV